MRRFVKQGGDFGKELAAVLQERYETEQAYARSLAKLAAKLNKACREVPGTITNGWRAISTEMETRSEAHRNYSNLLIEDIVKPLRCQTETHHKSRKTVSI